MQSIKDLVEHVKWPTLSKGSEYCVRVTCIFDPHNFFVRLKQFQKIIRYIAEMKPTLKPSSLQLHDIILFDLNTGTEKPEKYVRGKIMNVGKNGCNIYALDYGRREENIPFEKIWECDKSLKDMEPLAINCKLANCVPRGNSWGSAVKAFKTFVGKESAHMKIEDTTSDKLIVSLNNSCASDIATVLALSDYTTLGFVHNNLNKIICKAPAPTKETYKFRQLKLNESLLVRVVSGRSLDGFYVAEVSDYQEYLKKQEDVFYYSDSAKGVEKDTIECGDLVCSYKRFLTYERGYIKEIYADTCEALVQMVDTGKVKTVHFGRMKKTPPQCLTMPAIAIFCSVKEECLIELHLLLQPGTQFVITVQELGNKFETPNIVSISSIRG